MKHFVIPGLSTLLLLIILSSGCSSGSDCEALQAQNASLLEEKADLESQLQTAQSSVPSSKTDVELLQQDLNALTQVYQDTLAQMSTLEQDFNLLKIEHKSALTNIQSLEEKYQSLLKTTDQTAPRNPTWAELKAFILADDTDSHPYIADEFDCNGFTITLRDHAWLKGYRSAFVAIGFGKGAAGHAFNAFETADRGLIYIEPQHDAVAYLKTGSRFATIPLDGIKDRFIDCGSLNPEEFWKDATYSHYTGRLFDYAYYQNYAQRSQFCDDTVVAYNSEVNALNTAVDAFNQGSRTYSRAEIQSWSDRLANWSDNINALKADLGTNRVAPMDTVATIEIYWN